MCDATQSGLTLDDGDVFVVAPALTLGGNLGLDVLLGRSVLAVELGRRRSSVLEGGEVATRAWRRCSNVSQLPFPSHILANKLRGDVRVLRG